MAITVEQRTSIIELVVGMFGAAPGASVLSDLVAAYEAGSTLKQIAANLANTDQFKGIFPTFLTNAEFATKVVNQLVGSEVVQAEKDAAVTTLTGLLNGGQSRSSLFVDAINAVNAITSDNANWGNAGAAFDNKVSVAVYYSVDKQLSGSSLSALQNVISGVTSAAATVTTAKATADNTSTAGSVFVLTVGGDSFTGGNGNDTFTASETTAATWTVGDSINGGDGTDTLNVTQTAAITLPVGSSVQNVENINLLSGAAITIDASTGFTGLTALKSTSKSTAASTTLTAAATTDVTAIETDLRDQATSQLIINGGKDVTVTATGTNTNGTALTAATGAGAEILIGATTAVAGKVNVTNSFKGANTNVSGDIFVKGGSEVTVTQTLTNTTTNETNLQGAVSVVGTAATKAVTVNQDTTVTASATGPGLAGKTAGAVTITDVNSASTTAAGSIATVTLKSAGATTINSGALTTLNLAGTFTTVDASTLGALTTPANKTLALNLTGATSTGAVTIDSDITTLNVSGSTSTSTIASLVANGVTDINVSGAAAVTFTANTTGAVANIVVTNTAGASFGTALGTAVKFTGGAGADSIVLSNAFETAITMGAGNDTVTYAGPASTVAGKLGSVAAGDGTDVIIMTAVQADAADASSVFNSSFTGFETLRVSDALNVTVDLDGINGATFVRLDAGANAGTISNLVSGGTVQVRANSAGALTVNVKSALVGSADILNLALVKSGAAGVLAANTITAANVETINIAVADAGTTTSNAVIHTLTLAATSATSVVVTGNNGLNLTNTGNVAITNFDASAIVNNNSVDRLVLGGTLAVAATTDTAANLAVTFASANTTTTATVSIKGGAGNDVLTGNASIDTITGGAGADQVTGGLGADTIVVGSGHDIVVFVSDNNNNVAGAARFSDSSTAATDSITGYTLSSAITAVDLVGGGTLGNVVTAFGTTQATAGGDNLAIFAIDMDDTGNGGGNTAIAVEANATALAGQAAGVTYTVTNGILTLGGVGAGAVDTLGEWLTEAAAVAATAGDILAFQFGSDTYIFGENGGSDVFIKLVGVTGAAGLVEASAATTAAAGSIIFADIA